jgi:hypothetical protein
MPTPTPFIEKELDEFVASLEAASFRAKHVDFARLRQENTCEWLLQNAQFQKWMAWNTPFLWLYGLREYLRPVAATALNASIAAGSGKTTLMY